MANLHIQDLDLDDVPMEVFELADSGLTLRSLTAGHGTTENGASCFTICYSTTCHAQLPDSGAELD